MDGGLDSLLLGNPPDPLRVRKAVALLDAATVALLALVASESVVSWGGLLSAVLLSLCAMGAGQVDIFPYFRLAPILLATWGILRFSRTRRVLPLFAASALATLGVLGSLEVGLYATGAVVAWLVVDGLFFRQLDLSGRQIVLLFVAAALPPLLVLLMTGSSIPQFLRDSILIIPGAIDAVWSLPSPGIPSLLSLTNPLTLWSWLDSEAARYFLPPIFYGLLIALAGRDFKRGDIASARRLMALGIFSLVLLRTAVGRAGWSHTRFAAPFLGIAIVCALLEPAWRRFQSAGRARWLWLCGFLLMLLPTWALLEIREELCWPQEIVRRAGRKTRSASGLGTLLSAGRARPLYLPAERVRSRGSRPVRAQGSRTWPDHLRIFRREGTLLPVATSFADEGSGHSHAVVTETSATGVEATTPQPSGAGGPPRNRRSRQFRRRVQPSPCS